MKEKYFRESTYKQAWKEQFCATRASAKGCKLWPGWGGKWSWVPACVPLPKLCAHVKGLPFETCTKNYSHVALCATTTIARSITSAMFHLQIQVIIARNIFFITIFHWSRTKAIWEPRAVCCNGIFLMWKSKHCCCILTEFYPLLSTKLTVLVSCWYDLFC